MLTRFLLPVAIRNTDSRLWCRVCGGINQCHSWCAAGKSGAGCG